MTYRNIIALLILVSCGLTNRAVAQSRIKLEGVVVDSLTKTPIRGAVVLASHLHLLNLSATATTNEAGGFILEVADTGTYLLQFSSKGFSGGSRTIIVDKEHLNLDTLSLSAKATVLKDVEVKAQKKLIELTDDKLIYNVDSDPITRSEMALDILRRVPSVSVDGNDNVRLNGQTNFKVLLNGRETAMFTQNVSDALRGFPGTSIVRIEVITNPSAKYDAEGIGGIINIVTKKKIEGYNGSLNTWNTSINQHNVNANFNAKLGKLGIALNYGIRSNLNMPSGVTNVTIPTTEAFYSSRVLEGERVATFFSQFGNGELSWTMDSLHTLSVYGNLSGGSTRQRLDQTITTTLHNTPTPLISDFDQTIKRQFPTTTVGTDFIKKFAGNQEKEFSIRASAELGKSNAFLESVETTSFYQRFVINNSIANNRQYVIQSDYTHPIKAGAKLEVGARVTIRNASSDFESMTKYNSSESYQPNSSNTDDFQFSQDIYSVYGSYSFKIKSFKLRAGLRAEQTFINGDFHSAKAFARNSYTNLLPNFQVSRQLKDLNLVLSYNQRLQRPAIHHLNPFVENNDSLNISYGNPELDAQTIHTVMLQSRLLKGKTTFGLTFSGSWSNNMIVTLNSFNPSTGQRTNTYANAGDDFLFSANGNINSKLNNQWSFDANINFQYRVLKHRFDESIRNSGIGGNTSAGLRYAVNKSLFANGYVGFEQAIPDLQTTPNTIPFCGLGINYQLVENKLRVGLMGQNFFARYYDYKGYVTGTGFNTVNTNRNLMGKAVLTVNWNFGRLKEQVSRKKGVTVDDAL